jgi:chemotaxis protein CheC
MEMKKAPGDFNFVLNAFQKDALNELGNIASGHALTALSEMTSMTIGVEVPTVDVLVRKESENLKGADKMVIGTTLRLDGGFNGYLEVFFLW